ncbi:MAG TPA: hypothetical protein VF121_13460 [Thermoanaerobaculia bacterium]|nr:hypothetical protein [Thermoanaerobaculia bacterium]
MGSKETGIPDISSIVIPAWSAATPPRRSTFCERTFGALAVNRRPGSDGTVAHALLTIGPALLMIEAEWPTLPSRASQPDGSSPV